MDFAFYGHPVELPGLGTVTPAPDEYVLVIPVKQDGTSGILSFIRNEMKDRTVIELGMETSMFVNLDLEHIK